MNKNRTRGYHFYIFVTSGPPIIWIPRFKRQTIDVVDKQYRSYAFGLGWWIVNVARETERRKTNEVHK